MADDMTDVPFRAARLLIAALPEPPDRPGLADTPARFAKAWQAMTAGYGIDTDKLLKTFQEEPSARGQLDEAVFVGHIPFFSTCEHHLLPFFGMAHIAYIPRAGKIVGLSKFARLVDAFSRRLSVQERLTNQIADALLSPQVLNPIGVGVVLQARHMCMEVRGINRSGIITQTNALRGKIKLEPEARAEFFSMIPKIDRV